MFDKVVKVGASWDWVTPLISFILDWRYRPSTGYNLPFGHSYSAWEIKRFLKSKGIRVWGVMVIDDFITIRVREAQALYTQYWLEQLGIPYEGGLSPEATARYRANSSVLDAPKKGSTQEGKDAEHKDVVGSISDLADRINVLTGGQ